LAVTLSKRLSCIANHVEKGSRVVDVGTDHGYIPSWLIENGICSYVIASDIRPGPLKRAENTAHHAGVHNSIKFVLCNGLEGCDEESVDTVIIAGMGGETIINILSAAPWARKKSLIIQPQSKIPLLRSWLAKNGYRITSAELVYDAGRIYLVWCVSEGIMPEPGFIDVQLIENRDPLLCAYLDGEIKKKHKILHGMEVSANCDSESVEMCRKELEELSSVYEETLKWQQ